MIRFEDVRVTYPEADRPALHGVDLEVAEGELCLVVGPTGSGKSTLLRAACGLVPHFSGGVLEGRVTVDGRDTRTHLPRDLADVVGVVVQDPATGFVTQTVEEELAYAMEQLAVPAGTMRRRVEEVLDLMGLTALRSRALADLSGGEQQRAAIGAVLTAHPRVLVLDEPTSALDPAAAEEVLAALTRLVHDLGLTVLLAEHRLERVVQYADSVVVLDGGTVVQGPPAEVLDGAAVAPPIVELGRLAGWRPLPLSVRDARRRAPALREELLAVEQADAVLVPDGAPGRTGVDAGGHGTADPALLAATGVRVHHGTVRAVRGVDLTLRAGEVVCLMGRNGAGKSSLLWALQGSGRRTAGHVLATPADGAPPVDTAGLTPRDARRHVALVPQNPRDLLYLDSVAAECEASDRHASRPAGTTRDLLAALGPTLDPDRHPRDLSEGQQLTLALAVQLSAGARTLLLDEPTRGLDYATKHRLAGTLRAHAAEGGTVLLSTHDVEFAAQCATRVVIMADGELVADGPATDVLVGSPTFAPQVARILHPLRLLTVDAVRTALVGA